MMCLLSIKHKIQGEIISVPTELRKKWNDNENQDGIRPEEITVHLHADGEVIETIKLNAEMLESKNHINKPPIKSNP